MGRFEDSIRHAKKALELDPLSLIINRCVGKAYYLAGRYDEAIELGAHNSRVGSVFRSSAPDLGTFTPAERNVGVSGLDFREGVVDFSGVGLDTPTFGYAYAIMGRKDEALNRLHEVLEQSKHTHISPCNIAAIYGALGENDLAFEWLEKAYDNRSPDLAFAKTEPAVESASLRPSLPELADVV